MELVPWLSFLNFRGYWEWSGSGLHLPPRPKGGLVDTLRYQRKLPVCNILKYRKVLVEPDVPRLGRKPGVSPAETLNVESAEITPFLSSPDNFTLIPLSAVHQGLRDCAEKRQLPDVQRPGEVRSPNPRHSGANPPPCGERLPPNTGLETRRTCGRLQPGSQARKGGGQIRFKLRCLLLGGERAKQWG